MPKKRNYNFKQLQGKSSSPHPSSSQRDGETGSPSVNERLSELRKLEAKDAAAKKRELADSVNQRSVPPQVQGILGVPESAPPKSKAAPRTRERLRTPGPAPPKSWLAGGSTWSPALAMSLRGARTGLKKSANKTDRSRPKDLLRFASLSGLERVEEGAGVRRLTHIALKAIAESWDLFDQEDYASLVDIPLRLRLRLISYIGFYGPTANAVGIDALLQGTETHENLDLASLIGHGDLTVKKIMKILTRDARPESRGNRETVAESWDADESFEPSLQPPPRLNRAAQLTHLCLSHPGSGVSWRDLLSFAKHTPRLTHLSLAYWPWPTLTPNLATTTVSGRHGVDVNASASHYYAALDQKFEEPAILLRQLSSHLLCLQWLDLEGCQQWSPALAELAKPNIPPGRSSVRSSRNNDWIAQSEEAPVLAGNWKNLTYIRCAQGWLPSYWGMRALLSSSSVLPAAMEVLVSRSVVYYLEHTSEDRFLVPPEELTHDQIDMEKKRARMWVQAECLMTQAGLKVGLTRQDYACKATRLDYGLETASEDPTNFILRRMRHRLGHAPNSSNSVAPEDMF